MSAVIHNVKKVAEYCQQSILALLLNNEDLLHGILRRPAQKYALSQIALLKQTAEIISLFCDIRITDLVNLLEALPQDERLNIWHLVVDSNRDQVLVTVVEEVWGSLIKEVCHYSKDTISQMINCELVIVLLSVIVSAIHRFLHMCRIIPDVTDKLFVVDCKNILLRALPFAAMLLSDIDTLMYEVMNQDINRVQLKDTIDEAAARAVERYNLMNPPVIAIRSKWRGALNIKEIIDAAKAESDRHVRCLEDLNPQEDLCASIKKAVKTRWAWLAVNLFTAFMASRVIGLFEHTISQLLALAALMPIVAGIGGNAGNQTITIVVRALALREIEISNISRLLLRELGVAIINGVVWGGIMGVVIWLLYGNLAMSGVMSVAIILNLLVAALMGVMIPIIMIKLGCDPAIGSSVIITALTDIGGFFIFLSLSTLFLL